MYSVPPFRQGNPRYLIFGVTLNMLKALCTSGCFFSARYSVVCKVIFHAQGITSRVHGDHSRALEVVKEAKELVDLTCFNLSQSFLA